MAEYLASIFGTEKDKVNCSFYFKIGACRHGERCSRIHNKPTFSQTILLQNLYVNPQNSAKSADVMSNISEEAVQEHYDNFFEDVFVECEDKYGEIEEMNVCDNLGDHLVGNVYIKFRREEDAEKAVNELNNRWFGGRPIYAELSPVTDFREACCRQYELGLRMYPRRILQFYALKADLKRTTTRIVWQTSQKEMEIGGGLDYICGTSTTFVLRAYVGEPSLVESAVHS
ncbi:unnamed protein product [Notodromas monacha]|uniref:Splicing factor U2af 38 kDa subunit n=1 Tax=Notodromas monacha TaxID=399045 RepID=A0A7R9BIQ6_9CRUS|nr:unnamed protein product [Notodromas monacha]CAG0916264.1 unnamed protein product [Notodromas monacha]